MTAGSWESLPNAKHIDRMFESYEKNLHLWGNKTIDDHLWSDIYYSAWRKAWDLVWSDPNDQRTDVWNHAYEVGAHDTLRAALLALMAYEGCAYLLDQDPEHVKFLVDFGVDAAVLLYPACIVMKLEKEE